jgi:hypothetical protein
VSDVPELHGIDGHLKEYGDSHLAEVMAAETVTFEASKIG